MHDVTHVPLIGSSGTLFANLTTLNASESCLRRGWGSKPLSLPLNRGDGASDCFQDLQTADPKAHTANIKKAICDLVQHLRRDIDKIAEPKARALFETSFEVFTI